MRKRASFAVVLLVLAASSLTAVPALGRADATTVRVTAKEFKFTLAPKTAKAGVVAFNIKNAGKLPHDFKIKGKKSALIRPGKTAVLRVTLKKGRYPYLCTVAGHAAAGMKGVLTVK